MGGHCSAVAGAIAAEWTGPHAANGDTSGKGQGEIVDPGASLGQKSDADLANERKIAESHLIESLRPAEAGNVARNAREAVSKLCKDGSDQIAFDALEKLGNDVELVQHVAKINAKLANLRTVDVSRMSNAEIAQRAIVTVNELFGGLDTPLTKKFEKFFADENSQRAIVAWLASKELGR